MNLLPCPFCGRTELKVPLEMTDSLAEELNYMFAITCECGVQGAAGKNLEEAIALWNTRSLLSVFILNNYHFGAIIGVFDSIIKAESARITHIKENGLSPNDSKLGDCHLEIQEILINKTQENIYS